MSRDVRRRDHARGCSLGDAFDVENVVDQLIVMGLIDIVAATT